MSEQQGKPHGRGGMYVRVSGRSQDVRSQRESIDRWLARHGLTIPEHMVFSDTGSRDLSHKRADFQRLLQYCSEDRVDYVVVDALDRFGVSDAWELGAFIWRLRQNDVSLWSCLEGELTRDDLATPILSGIAASRSKDEQVQRAERTIRAKVSQAERGEWTGGFCPFAWDVACFGVDGAEKWRVYYTTASDRRLKIWPDGRREECDGKRRFPKKDKGEVLRLVPSHDRTRVGWLRKIYEWFLRESITLRALATRLNQLGVHPVNGDQWYSSRVKGLLTNPLNVCGATVLNKRSQGRFLQYTEGGELRKVQKVKGRAPGSRRNPESYHVYPKAAGEGLIDRATFDAVQAKLLAMKRQGRKAPRNANLWLGGPPLLRPVPGTHVRLDREGPDALLHLQHLPQIQHQPQQLPPPQDAARRTAGPHRPLPGGNRPDDRGPV